MIGDIAFIMIVLEWLRPDKIIQRRILAAKQATQKAARALYQGPDFLFCFRYQLLLKFVFFGLMFSTAVPTAPIAVLVFMVESFVIDKYNFLRQYKKPRIVSNNLLLYILEWVMPVAIVLHLAFGVIFLKQYAKGSKAYLITVIAAVLICLPLIFIYIRDWYKEYKKGKAAEEAVKKIEIEGDHHLWNKLPTWDEFEKGDVEDIFDAGLQNKEHLLYGEQKHMMLSDNAAFFQMGSDTDIYMDAVRSAELQWVESQATSIWDWRNLSTKKDKNA